MSGIRSILKYMWVLYIFVYVQKTISIAEVCTPSQDNPLIASCLDNPTTQKYAFRFLNCTGIAYTGPDKGLIMKFFVKNNATGQYTKPTDLTIQGAVDITAQGFTPGLCIAPTGDYTKVIKGSYPLLLTPMQPLYTVFLEPDPNNPAIDNLKISKTAPKTYCEDPEFMKTALEPDLSIPDSVYAACGSIKPSLKTLRKET